jgi:hypothetical protein
MLFFCVAQGGVVIAGNWKYVVSSGKLSDGGEYQFRLQGLPADAAAAGPALLDALYIGSAYEVECTRTGLVNAGLQSSLRVLGNQEQSRVARLHGFPRNVGRQPGQDRLPRSLSSRLGPLAGRNPLRVAILNGMGSGMGDSIAGLRALEIFHEELSRACPRVFSTAVTLFPAATATKG